MPLKDPPGARSGLTVSGTSTAEEGVPVRHGVTVVLLRLVSPLLLATLGDNVVHN